MPHGDAESVFDLREKAQHWRKLADQLVARPDAQLELLDYADELDLRANLLEEADGLAMR